MSNDYFVQSLAESGFCVSAIKELPARPVQLKSVPDTLNETLASHLRAAYPGGLYAHQADALRLFETGENICLATSTASGKSLVFMAAAMDLICRKPTARVLALYPARALLQDQAEKWEAFAAPFGARVGRIDGGVPSDTRAAILRDCAVILMTPDVLHAWLMSHLQDAEIARFLRRLDLLVLDEAHVYDGVFGTNMAYLLRRFNAVAKSHRLICCTATLHTPQAFIKKLTGRSVVCFGSETDASPAPGKSLFLAEPVGKDDFEATVSLLRTLSQESKTRFIAFTDSRRAVEQFVAATQRGAASAEDDGEAAVVESEAPDDANRNTDALVQALHTPHVLPYRAGYEEQDRNRIQNALSTGNLNGVVSTSALELGLDIGGIDLVILIGLPTSMKAFWQRVGRAGRRDHAGTCLLLDTRRTLQASPDRFAEYLARPIEPSWIYMDNRFIQYANALCAASEWQTVGLSVTTAHNILATFPETFRNRLLNELSPQESVPEDLYALKKEAQNEPHRAFPLRDAGEKNFQIKLASTLPERLGSASVSQALREAYPGAVYYYLAQPYRVKSWDYRHGEIACRHEKRYHTKPLSQATVFPRFQGMFRFHQAANGFLAETALQVSERVLGFTEQRGSTKTEHRYGAGSFYSQQAQVRHFQTTGVCWCFSDKRTDCELIALCIKEAYCVRFGVQERDLSVGVFRSKQHPAQTNGSQEECGGVCIFDVTNGSLRLSERIAEHFSDILDEALSIARDRENDPVIEGLLALKHHAAGLKPMETKELLATTETPDALQDEWVSVIAPGEKAIYFNSNSGITKDVEILGYRYTPKGMVYDLVPQQRDVTRWQVPHAAITAIHGISRLLRYNVNTGDEETA